MISGPMPSPVIRVAGTFADLGLFVAESEVGLTFLLWAILQAWGKGFCETVSHFNSLTIR
jgi:hypothetical protein